jgi:hypothetical protein
VPALERGKDLRHFATINPRFSQPTIFFGNRHKVYERSRRNEVMDKMPARPHDLAKGASDVEQYMADVN